MARGRITSLTIRLLPPERQTLRAWQRATTIPAGRARRGRIISLAAERTPIAQIAATIGISRRFVYKWIQRSLQKGLEGLADKSGRGAHNVTPQTRWAQKRVTNSLRSFRPEPTDASALFAECMALNRKAFAAGFYNTAYHALAAALYIAHARQDAEGLAQVERLAVEQLALIAATAPGYEYSTRSAEASGLPSIFTMLAREAQTMLLRLPPKDDSA